MAFFLLGLNVVLLFVGGLVEIYAAIVVVVPLLGALAWPFGLDPIHSASSSSPYGAGFLCPPVGLNLLSPPIVSKTDVRGHPRHVSDALVLLVGVLLITTSRFDDLSARWFK